MTIFLCSCASHVDAFSQFAVPVCHTMWPPFCCAGAVLWLLLVFAAFGALLELSWKLLLEALLEASWKLLGGSIRCACASIAVNRIGLRGFRKQSPLKSLCLCVNRVTAAVVAVACGSLISAPVRYISL